MARRGRAKTPVTRDVNYRQLRNPFPPMEVFSTDEVASMHDTALRTLEELGMKVLLPEARAVFAKGGARVDGEMVYIGRDMVAAAISSAPKSIDCRAGARHRDIVMELGTLTFQPGAGAPHATDLKRGRRPGSAQDFKELVRLTQHFDVFQMVAPLVEPQDVPTHLRHYFTVATPHCYTIINTNSPRTLDIPMAQGLIDFAKLGQMSIVTPFTLMGAMAPITVAGAVTLSHLEALAAITLTQLVRPGAPVCYGTFTSNVDMKSGSPAFGTPAHFQASLAAGQMARLIGLPWRSAAGSASNTNDVQAANENQMGLWGCLMAGASVIIHSAGWLEGGLSISYEKLITDVEVLNMVAELCGGAKAGPDEIGFAALQEVAPSGHFFATAQTMGRYNTEFYEPLVHDYANFGTWEERGAQGANDRATDVWQRILADGQGPPVDGDRLAALEHYIRAKTDAGGAPPES